MARALNHRAAALRQSAIRAMSIECAAAGGINLAQGICDTAVPEAVASAVAAVVAEGFNTYSRYDGAEELRVALAAKMRDYNGLDYDPAREIVVTSGATGAFFLAVSALLEAGDEVLLFEPYYGYHVNTLRAVDMVPLCVPLLLPDWSLDREAIERAVGKRTRAILINTPANPCGKVFTREELLWLGDLAASHDLWIFTDEVYEHFVYDGARHTSPATIPGLRERTITMSSLSKTLAVTGWRLGWMAADERWTRAFGPLNDLFYVCPPTPLQVAAARGLSALDGSYYETLAREHQAKRDRFCASLEHAGLAPHRPQGAYYVLADASPLPGASSWERARYLLARTGLASVPGEAFLGEQRGVDLLRFCFGKTEADLAEACRRLEAFTG